MTSEPQTLLFLTELLGVVMRHDPVTMAKVVTITETLRRSAT